MHMGHTAFRTAHILYGTQHAAYRIPSNTSGEAEQVPTLQLLVIILVLVARVVVVEVEVEVESRSRK